MNLRVLYHRSEDEIPDPYLLLASAKQHLTERDMDWGDTLAWVLLDEFQEGFAHE